MPNSRTCPKCGAVLRPDAPEGLCPRCLIDGGLATNPDAGGMPSDSARTVLDQTADIPVATGARVHYFGDYELLAEIARGGMGVVYRARQVSLKRIVALKMILAGRLASEAEVQRFRAEAEAAANLQHPNIVAIHEIGAHEGQQYFSMDYVEGQNLAAVIQGKPLAARRAADLTKIMAEAIHYAHQRGILHRDLKPQNVLLDEHGQPRITDFGIAKQIAGESSLTRTGAVMGTPSYMPPEQATGRQDLIGPHSDVYALGAILYEMLTGRPPFKAETPVATLRQVMDAPPARPTKLNESVPPDLETICLKCLEKEPQRRYATARAFAEDLERFLRQEPILARPISAARRTGHWLRGHPWTLAGVATVLVMGLLAVAFWLWQENRFLRFAAAHPEYVRKAGAQKMEAGIFLLAFFIALITGCLAAIRYRMKSRRLTWEQVHDWPVVRSAACGPVSRRLRNACLVTAAAQCGLGLLLLFWTIAAVVWEGVARDSEVSVAKMVLALVLCFLGVLFFGQVAREQTAVAYGLPVESKPLNLKPRTRSIPQRLVTALGPGVVIGTAIYFTNAGLAPASPDFAYVPHYIGDWQVPNSNLTPAWLNFATGWLVGVISTSAYMLGRFMRRYSYSVRITAAITVSTVYYAGLSVALDFGGIHFGLILLTGLLVGSVSTTLAFRGIVFDRVPPAKPGADSPRPS